MEIDLDAEMGAVLAEAVADPRRAARVFELAVAVHGPQQVVAALQRVTPARPERGRSAEPRATPPGVA